MCEQKLERARDLYVYVSTERERAAVDHWKGQVARTGNTGGRAQRHLDDANKGLSDAEERARQFFTATVNAED